jgi:hypothetical protein
LNEENGGQPNSIAPDGSLLVFRTASQPYDLRVLPLDGSGPSRPLVADPKFSEVNGEVSPDGRWIAYESDESGGIEVFVRPFPGVDRGRWQVSSGGGHSPLWARSGRELYFESVSPSRLMAASIPPIPPNAAFASGKPEPLFDFTPYRAAAVGRMYDQALDGRFVTVKQAVGNAPAARREALVIVSHWFDELKASVLPETKVTFHSGHMGDTLPCKGRVSCHGRSVVSWTIASGLSPGCSTARRWRRSVRNSASPGRRGTRFTTGIGTRASKG